MNLFEFNKTSNKLIILVGIIGVLSLVFPWIYYPRLELNIYGHNGDGWLISMMFLVVVFIGFLSTFKKSEQYRGIYNILIFCISLIILFLCIYKVYAFHEEVYNFKSDNPLLNYSGAGAKLNFGLYAIAGLSFLSAFLSSVGTTFTKSKLPPATAWY